MIKPIKLTISGALLKPEFAIYLLEIVDNIEDKYYYLGMTGDNVYPSARAAFFRIAGHLEAKRTSTQNQLGAALRDVLQLETERLYKSNINMYSYPIVGFKKWTVTDDMKWETLKGVDYTKQSEYKRYKNVQEVVLSFEKHMVHKLNAVLLSKNRRALLNKDIGISDKSFGSIFNKNKEDCIKHKYGPFPSMQDFIEIEDSLKHIIFDT